MPARSFALLLCLLAFSFVACVGRGSPATITPDWPPAPTPIPTPSWHELGELYLVAADRAGRDYDRLFLRESAYREEYGDTVKGYHLWCEAFMAVDVEFKESVEAIPWTDDYREQADAVLEETDAVMALLKKCIKSKAIKTIRATANKIDAAYLARQKASERLRKDLHLSTRSLH